MIISGSFARGFEVIDPQPLTDEEVLRRLLAMDCQKDLHDVMNDVVECGLHECLFEALVGALERAEAAEKRRQEAAAAEESAG